jgi:formylglycine-generating enzyme required for sulfatase activity
MTLAAGEVERSTGHSLVAKPLPVGTSDTSTRVTAFVNKYDATGGMYSVSPDGKRRQLGRTWKDPGFPQDPNHPVVGINIADAEAFCAWLTKTERDSGLLPAGWRYRLPTDEEWVFAAGEKARDEVLPLADPVDPAQAWIARYEAEANRARPGALDPQPVGSFGRNENGLQDLGGNVWEWTNSCFLRMTLEPAGTARVTNTNCGVRVVQGAHRTYMTDFIRDPRTGGCAAGVPPANLGFRLVVEDKNWPALQRMIVATFRPH